VSVTEQTTRKREFDPPGTNLVITSIKVDSGVRHDRQARRGPPSPRRGNIVRLTHSFLSLGFVLLNVIAGGTMVASPASADCTDAGYATVCAQGDVRGGGPTPPSAAYPSYCADPWYCDDGWDMDVIWNPGIDIGGPGRPGGIGPRR
jgi:hypothetical protein